MKESHNTACGSIYVVATPIGNLQDISARALETLRQVDLIVAEDTRHTAALLAHFGIRKRAISLHMHNEQRQTAPLLERVRKGESIALVSDAGTPLISDPGFELVRAASQTEIPVIPIPGASALITALSASGVACDRFSFEGFLPAKGAGRRKQLDGLRHETRTMVFYESPRRVVECLSDMKEAFGAERNICVARELTKLHEEIVTAPLAQACEQFTADTGNCRGEFVLVVEGGEAAETTAFDQMRLLETLLDYLSVKDAAAVAAKLTEKPKKELYNQLLKIRASRA